MELHLESNPGLNTVTAYGHNYIEINAVRYDYAVYFSPEQAIKRWDIQAPGDITAGELRQVAGVDDTGGTDPLAFLDGTGQPEKPADAPEVVLIGTGARQHLLPARVTQGLLGIGIGVEAMDTQAAARTYNILMAEGRRVVAALLPLEDEIP